MWTDNTCPSEGTPPALMDTVSCTRSSVPIIQVQRWGLLWPLQGHWDQENPLITWDSLQVQISVDGPGSEPHKLQLLQTESDAFNASDIFRLELLFPAAGRAESVNRLSDLLLFSYYSDLLSWIKLRRISNSSYSHLILLSNTGLSVFTSVQTGLNPD